MGKHLQSLGRFTPSTAEMPWKETIRGVLEAGMKPMGVAADVNVAAARTAIALDNIIKK